MRNTIKLEVVNERLRTSWTRRRGGGTRDRYGKPYPFGELMTVGESSYKSAWKATAGTAEALDKADQAVCDAGGTGLRITELIRNVDTIVRERQKLNNWHAAGKPDPNGTGYDKVTMRHVYLADVNSTNHQWGGAVDLDIAGIRFEGIDPADADAHLSKLWEILIPHGFRPIIEDPRAKQSEAWHFDRLGMLEYVRGLFLKHKEHRYATLTANVGCILAGTFHGDRVFERHVQALLLLAAGCNADVPYIGKPDGYIGKRTMTGLEAVGIKGVTNKTPASQILAMLTEAGVGTDAVTLI